MQRRAALTLVEVLVVATIIILLVGLTSAVFLSATRQARQVSCASQLKQLTLASISYTSDYDDELPRHLGQLGASNRVTKDLVFCPYDDKRKEGGQWCSMIRAVGQACEVETSYGYVYGQLAPLHGTPLIQEDIEEWPVLFACILHGDDSVALGNVELRGGKVLTALRDGSIHQRQVALQGAGIDILALFRK